MRLVCNYFKTILGAKAAIFQKIVFFSSFREITMTDFLDGPVYFDTWSKVKWEKQLAEHKQVIEDQSKNSNHYHKMWTLFEKKYLISQCDFKKAEKKRQDAELARQDAQSRVEILRKQVAVLSRRGVVARIWTFFTNCCSKRKRLLPMTKIKPLVDTAADDEILENKEMQIIECNLDGGWTPYHVQLSKMISGRPDSKHVFLAKHFVQFDSSDGYSIELKTGLQTNQRTQVQRPIRVRTIQLERQIPRLPSLPSCIDKSMTSLEKYAVDLAFYDQSSVLGKTSMRKLGAKIISIERVVKSDLEFLYSCKKYAMEFPNEKKLMFHSTGNSDYKNLVDQGPDFRCSSEKNLFGKGFYSAIDPEYCHRMRPHELNETKRESKTYVMLVSSILAGNPYNASCLAGRITHWTRPPTLSPDVTFDSILADYEGTRMYVTFDNSQSLLTHVIKYKMEIL